MKRLRESEAIGDVSQILELIEDIPASDSELRIFAMAFAAFVEWKRDFDFPERISFDRLKIALSDYNGPQKSEYIIYSDMLDALGHTMILTFDSLSKRFIKAARGGLAGNLPVPVFDLKSVNKENLV